MEKSCHMTQVHSSLNDRALIGMAMRYALMEMWGLSYLRDHPMSRSYKNQFGEDFAEVLTSFGSNKEQGFLHLALIDKQMRGTLLDPFWDARFFASSVRGLRHLDPDPRIAAACYDIAGLYNDMLEHFQHPSIVGRVTTCPYCGVTQFPEKIWSCKKCGAPLTYNGVEVSGLSLSNKPDYQYVDLNPTYAREIGGSDAPLAVAWRAFSIRTIARPLISPEHVLMNWGWWALYNEKECPPWETSTIYYSRQQYELTFEFKSLHKMLGINLDDFHKILKENYSPRTRVARGSAYPSDWIPTDIGDLFIGMDGDPSEYGDW